MFNFVKCVLLPGIKAYFTFFKFVIMVRTKNNFKPFRAPSDSGSSINEPILDGSVVANSYSEKVTLDTLNKMNPLEQPTPFEVDSIPEGVIND